MSTLPPPLALCQHIHLVRGHPVVLQHDLARLYETPTEQVTTHAERFPGDLCFTLENVEMAWVEDQPEAERRRMYGFTEHGALALAYALNSPTAMAMGMQVVRAFVEVRRSRNVWLDRLPPIP